LRENTVEGLDSDGGVVVAEEEEEEEMKAAPKTLSKSTRTINGKMMAQKRKARVHLKILLLLWVRLREGQSCILLV